MKIANLKNYWRRRVSETKSQQPFVSEPRSQKGWNSLYLWINFVAIVLLIVDRVIKLYFFKNPSSSFGGDFFYGILQFNFAKNFGIAFGINLNSIVLFVLIFLILIILINVLIKAYLDNDVSLIFGLSLIFAGAISNVIDRFSYGFVVDYINLKYFTVFNLADAMITVGVVILIFDLWFKKRATV